MRLRSRLKLFELHWKQRKNGRQIDRLVRRSGKSVTECSGETWYADLGMEWIILSDEELTVISDALIDQAQNLYLPTPLREDKKKWETGQDRLYPRILTAEAMTELRAAIRKERIERRASVEWWLKIVGGTVGILTGLIGALIGLIAILKK